MIRIILSIALLCAAGQVSALTLAECERTTHISHGGEAGHRDFGGGRVGYGEWWSQEGVFTDIVIADCKTGEFLRTRAREEHMRERPPFDRTADVIEIIETQMSVSPALFSFQRLHDALKNVGRDIELAEFQAEPCACAAVYPELLGEKHPFERDQ
ncbi:MAG: hypothetical protein OXQ92_07180 [Boseongicola sp.]|nr:hypothetical protein [Boseongicola sp.]